MSDRTKRRKVRRIRIRLPENSAEGSNESESEAARPSRDDVGYANPPREHQFKPGRSGNPNGRPKGAKSESTILHEMLHRKIKLRENGRERWVTVLEAMLLRFAEDSLKGNTKSAQFLLNRYGSVNAGDVQADHLNEDERQILESYARRLLEQHRETEGNNRE